MPRNPFYVHSGTDFGPGLMGLAQTLGEVGEIKKADPEIIEGLESRLKDTKEGVRGKTVDALRSIGNDSIPTLIRGYHKSVKFRIFDFKIPFLLFFIPFLGFLYKYITKEFFPSNDFFVKTGFISLIIAETSWRIGSIISSYEIYNFVFGNFFRYFKGLNKIYKHKILIISAIGGIGEDVQEHISFVIEQLKTGRKFVKVEAARALGRIGIEPEKTVYSLEEALSSPGSVVRREAALSLGKLGSSAAAAIPSLIFALDDRNPDVRWRSSEALGKIGVNTEEILSSLNILIHDKCDYVCESAINAIDNLTE